MRFADEMRGSEGERCDVTDLRVGKVLHGTVEEWDDETKRAIVLLDSGSRISVGYSFVQLEGEES